MVTSWERNWYNDPSHRRSVFPGFKKNLSKNGRSPLGEEPFPTKKRDSLVWLIINFCVPLVVGSVRGLPGSLYASSKDLSVDEVFFPGYRE